MPDPGLDPLDPLDPTTASRRHAAGPRPRSGAGAAPRPGLGRTGGGVAVLAVLAVGTAALVGGRGAGVPDGQPSGPGQLVDISSAQPVALATFRSCDTLLSYYRNHALPQVGPYGLPGGNYAVPMEGIRRAAGGAAGGVPVPVPAAANPAGVAPQSATDTTAGAAGAAGAQGALGATSAGGTNVQVAGVDEADVSKRVGDLVLTVAGNGRRPGLVVLRTAAGTATVVGRLDTPDWMPSSLLVDGTRALLIGQIAPLQPAEPQSGGPMTRMPLYRPPATRVVQVDLADPAHPKAVSTLDLDGAQVGVRMVDGEVRVAVNSSFHQLPFVLPQYPSSPGAEPQPGQSQSQSEAQVKAAEDAATAANREVVNRSTLDDWLPTYTLRQGDGTSTSGRLLDCADVSAPSRFAGLDTLSLVSMDLRGGGVPSWTASGVVAAGTTLYATAEHTYLAATTWTDTVQGAGSGPAIGAVAGGQSTQIHVFDTSGRGRPNYLASGQVPGALLNQFSMDEFGGDLRVATTANPFGGPILMGGGTVMLGSGSGPVVDVAPAPSAPRPAVADASQVTVLRRSGDRLGQVGQVSGLGRGERIHAVRFIGSVGYVVTFRQTDPLYTIDLSTPTRPRVAGELKLLGYSAYLHPARDGLLIGIGQAADAAGRVQGLQLSLFDVHDPAKPVRLSQVKLPTAWSDAESDHHAFTFADSMVLIPFQRSEFGIVAPAASAGGPADGAVGSAPAMPMQDSGVVAVRLDGQRFAAPSLLRMLGTGQVRADQVGEFVAPLRTYVDGGDIWTVTTGGLGIHDARTFKRLGFTSY